MPTPRPIITPRKIAKSGIRKVFERIVAIIEPTMIPASATPMGSPMARTEPNATTRMTMAKAEAERLGLRLLELAEGAAAELDLHAVDLGEELLERLGDRRGVGPVGAGDLQRGEGDLAGLGALGGDLRLGRRLVRAGEGHPLPRLEVGLLERRRAARR